MFLANHFPFRNIQYLGFASMSPLVVVLFCTHVIPLSANQWMISKNYLNSLHISHLLLTFLLFPPRLYLTNIPKNMKLSIFSILITLPSFHSISNVPCWSPVFICIYFVLSASISNLMFFVLASNFLTTLQLLSLILPGFSSYW